MKAKVKKTGEIVDVMLIEGTEHTYTDSYCNYYSDKDLEFIPEIDWEQRRFELVKASIQGILSRGNYAYGYDTLATESIGYADAVIAKLKEE